MDACWPWVGKAKANGGYGLLSVDGKACRAHRLAWELANGPIPAGLFCCHKCDNPACCNPSHIFLGTAADNLRDMREKSRDWNLSHAPALVERLRNAKIGKPRSIEVREKLRLASLNHYAKHGNARLGLKHSEETKQKFRDAWVNRVNRVTKLKESDVVQILKSNDRQSDLAEKYSVSASVISHIKTRRIWKHVAI